MKDFLDQELKVGDKIVACVPHGKNSGASLVKGEVTGFTKKMIRAKLPGYASWMKAEERLIDPSKVTKINDSDKVVSVMTRLAGMASCSTNYHSWHKTLVDIVDIGEKNGYDILGMRITD